MKKNFILFFCLFSLLGMSQNPDMTVNFSTAISGVPNYATVTEALSATTGDETIWVAAGVYKEVELVVPVGVTMVGGYPANATSADQRVYPGNATAGQLSVLDGGYLHRVAKVYGTLDGFVIKKGYVHDSIANSINGAGGGVLIDGGIVLNSILTNNVAARRSPSPNIIPGRYVASVGDIYCTDGTILQPVYSLNNIGQIVAVLSGGIPAGKIPQGIVFYVDPSPTSGKFYIMGKVSSSNLVWSNPTYNVPNVPNMTNLNVLEDDFDGETKTAEIIAYMNSRWASQGNPTWWDYKGLKYAFEYNQPAGTQGQWYLPASGELLKLWKVYPQMEACARDVLGWTATQMFTKSYYWSSTEYNANDAWGLDTNGYPWSWGFTHSSKTRSGLIIPIARKSMIE